MQMDEKLAKYSWTDTDRFTRKIADYLWNDQFEPQAIVGVLRGGCIPAVHLSHLLKVRPFYAIDLQTTVSDEVRAARVLPKPRLSAHLEALKGLRVLIVDDVVNTGSTISAATHLVNVYGPEEVRTAVLVWDKLLPTGVDTSPTPPCEYWVEAVEAWVVFPWNR